MATVRRLRGVDVMGIGQAACEDTINGVSRGLKRIGRFLGMKGSSTVGMVDVLSIVWRRASGCSVASTGFSRSA